ncbi:MAG: biopolymer transporter ExbD [Bacteriovoracaceae bacterium]|nr:biopolymer transporter ExbD [Bacteriovoracaceae bacterium]
MARKRSRESLAPDITPLIDVVFLLLIFFMVSTVFKKDELALLLSLPKTTQGEVNTKQADQYFIEVTSDDIAYNGKSTTIKDLASDLSQIKDKTASIELRIDEEVKYARVVSVLDILKNNNLHNLALITKHK